MFKKPEHQEPEFNRSESDFSQSASTLKSGISAVKPAENAVIGSSLIFKGELTGEGNLLIDGRVEGTIMLRNSTLTIGRKGQVKANITAKLITIEGTVEGDLKGEEGVIVHQTGVVKGNITAPRVNLEDGAKFKGSIDMGSEVKYESVTSSIPQSVAASH